MFGIPPERVIGSYVTTKLEERDGRTVLVFDGRIAHLNDGAGKPVAINLALGTRPVFVAGNEGGRGDIAMMRWSKDRRRVRASSFSSIMTTVSESTPTRNQTTIR